MNSFAQTTTSNMNLGPCRVTFNGVDLGGTLDNVVVSIKASKAEIKADQTGISIRDRAVSGSEITVTTSLVETELYDNWKVAFPNASLVTEGLNKMIYWAENIGDRDLDNSHILILHPLSKDDADKSGDFKFFLACASAESEFVQGPEEQSKLKVVWNILPDDSVVPNRYFVYGDPAIGIVDAAAATASYSGTGNGVISGLQAGADAVTETVTATCIATAIDGGIFEVDGSVSGPLGNATVGIGFTSSKVDFTINDGSTDFVLNDAFTISVSGANYV